MNKQILFIHGGGNGGYEVDKKLVASLQESLGKSYDIRYPEIKPDESAPDFGWLHQLSKIISETESNFIVVAHSFGASMILKFLSENSINKKIKGIFLIATPFWNGNENWQKGLQLRKDFADKLPAETPIFFYHCKDDEEAPFAHMQQYKQKLPHANFHAIKNGGHQFNNDLSLVANDIKLM